MTAIIANTTDRRAGKDSTEPNAHGRIRPSRDQVYINESIIRVIRENGGEVILLPPEPNDVEDTVTWTMEHCDGIVITGGNFDIHPSVYGQTVRARIDRVDTGRTNLEIALARRAIAVDKPILGICGGMQALAVAGGGTLIQDIGTQVPGALEHEQPRSRATLAPHQHRSGLIRKAFGCGILRVNSTHHQAVKDPGCFRVTARHPVDRGSDRASAKPLLCRCTMASRAYRSRSAADAVLVRSKP